MEVLSAQGGGASGRTRESCGSCEASARRGLRPVGSWRAGRGGEVLRMARVCVCVRGRGTVGRSGVWKERKNRVSGSCPCPLSSNRGQDTDAQSRSRWHRSLLLSCSGRAWEKLASLGAAGAFAHLLPPSVMPKGLGGELEGSKQE